MKAIWRVRIQYYSIGTLILWGGVFLHKHIWLHTFIVPFITGAAIIIVFGGYMMNVENLLKDDCTYKDDDELEDSPD